LLKTRSNAHLAQLVSIAGLLKLELITANVEIAPMPRVTYAELVLTPSNL
jgi:hypothetical protein